MGEDQAPSYRAGLQDLVATLAGFYPAAVRAGLGYWAEMTANTAGYSADVWRSLLATYQRPQDGARILGEFVERFKTHLERTADSGERALLTFNEALEASRRREN